MNLTHTFYIELGDREFAVDVNASLYKEKDYGADADGNRGMTMEFLEDIEVDCIDPVDGGSVSKEEENAILKLAEELAEDHDWHEDINYPEYEREDY